MKKEMKKGKKFVTLSGLHEKVSHLWTTKWRGTLCGLAPINGDGDKFHTKQVGRLCGNCVRTIQK